MFKIVCPIHGLCCDNPECPECEGTGFVECEGDPHRRESDRDATFDDPGYV